MSLVNEKYPFFLSDNEFINQEKFIRYIRSFKSLNGWFSLGAVRIFDVIDNVQKKNNISGNLFEIGVHQGKSAIMLGLMADFNNEIIGFCDNFKSQNDEKIFLKNISEYSATFNLYEKLSQNLTLEETRTDCRIFHIDGGHSAEETYKDLTLAEKSISQKGIIIIDDCFNPYWPGVSEGVYKFLFKKPEYLAPLIIGHNKYVFCRIPEHEWYFNQLIDKKWRYYPTGLDFYTHPSKSFGFNTINISSEEPKPGRNLTIMEKIFRFSRWLKIQSKAYRKAVNFIKRR